MLRGSHLAGESSLPGGKATPGGAPRSPPGCEVRQASAGAFSYPHFNLGQGAWSVAPAPASSPLTPGFWVLCLSWHNRGLGREEGRGLGAPLVQVLATATHAETPVPSKRSTAWLTNLDGRGVRSACSPTGGPRSVPGQDSPLHTESLPREVPGPPNPPTHTPNSDPPSLLAPFPPPYLPATCPPAPRTGTASESMVARKPCRTYILAGIKPNLEIT